MLICSCATPEYLPEDALYQYLSDESNGVAKSTQSGAVTMKVTHRPADFMIWQELEEETDSMRIRRAFDRYDNYLYFMLQLSAGEKDALYGTSSNQADFNEKLQTLSFRMMKYIQLSTSEQDTIPLADAYYNRLFGLGRSNDILLVFNKDKIQSDEWVSIDTKEFGFKTGRRSFRFYLKDIDKTPKLTQLKPYYEIYKN